MTSPAQPVLSKQLHFVIDGDMYRTTHIYRAMTGITGHFCMHQPATGGYVKLSRGGMIEVGAGTQWDGPSGPAVDTISFHRASLVHDCLYLLIQQGCLPKSCRGAADKVMRKIAAEDGMSWWRRWYAWGAVRALGWRHV